MEVGSGHDSFDITMKPAIPKNIQKKTPLKRNQALNILDKESLCLHIIQHTNASGICFPKNLDNIEQTPATFVITSCFFSSLSSIQCYLFVAKITNKRSSDQ